ncbi:uncharacterized protein LOC130800863 [Amaranthus tricolor]|uniref:uncharacterized protein LOC130800863 n=1 Tax=Amaranthus tricolor TaxID=29722 RepID=UPI002582A2C6|nr:uncharacterized protein LOC130800863 [Amaranthus tricolor]
MLTMFPIEKILETITKKPKSPPKKLQRSPKIVGYARSEYPENDESLNLREPLLSSLDEEKIEGYDQGKMIIKEVNNKINNSVRVKVLLTKEEATKLLAKCKEEGALDFKEVVNQLVNLPAQRINVVSSIIKSPSIEKELSTIIEEEEEYDEYYHKNK